MSAYMNRGKFIVYYNSRDIYEDEGRFYVVKPVDVHIVPQSLQLRFGGVILELWTGLFDKNRTPIYVGDRTRLVLEDGEVREFEVCFKTVQRTTIKTLRGFEPESVDVSITGIFFCWEGNDLLPCVDENGVSDVEKMEVIQPPEWGASGL